jgi:hypothetical protein
MLRIVERTKFGAMVEVYHKRVVFSAAGEEATAEAPRRMRQEENSIF